MKKRNKLLATGAILALLAYHSIDYQYHPVYEIYEEDKDGAFGRYSKGNIYIGDLEFLLGLKNLKKEDVLVLDLRDGDDPNMKIFNSNLISDKNIRNEILEVLCRYEECHPSKWNRTIESMRVEWLMHNLSYLFDYESHRTRDVDFDNNDEEKYDSTILRKILKL